MRHTVAFHRVIVRAAGNAVLLHTWESLGIEVWTTLSIRWFSPEPRSHAQDHQEIVDAFRRRDPKIGTLLKAHVLSCAPRV